MRLRFVVDLFYNWLYSVQQIEVMEFGL